MNSDQPIGDDLAAQLEAVSWYHTIDLGNGQLTPGAYDHRPYLARYGFPADLTGKTVLDIGAASGYFSFEFERRGATVTATELPEWFDHDFGPRYEADQAPDVAREYLLSPFEIAKNALGSRVNRRLINVYDISPESVGTYDLVFCGSLLIHLTDPVKALWNIRAVTREKAIIATVITPNEPAWPFARFVGQVKGDTYWEPTRACLELMAASAGFLGIEWVDDFQLNYRDSESGPYHGILHVYPTLEGWTERTRHRDEVIAAYQLTSPVEALAAENEQLRDLVAAYEKGLFVRFMRWLKGQSG